MSLTRRGEADPFTRRSCTGPTRPPFDVEGRIQNWSVQQDSNLFPNAHLHTQWPGTGKPRDPFFDQFYASQVQLMVDPVKTQEYAQKALAALLDRIGPAILLTHSQSGTFGFLVADQRPDLVKGVVTVEGGGMPPRTPVGPPRWFEDARLQTSRGGSPRFRSRTRRTSRRPGS